MAVKKFFDGADAGSGFASDIKGAPARVSLSGRADGSGQSSEQGSKASDRVDVSAFDASAPVMATLPRREDLRRVSNVVTSYGDEDYDFPQVDSVDKLIEAAERKAAQIKTLSDEDIEKLRRRRRVESIISGISDGVSAISNFVTTTQYAPSMGDSSMTGAIKERYDRIMARNRQNEDEWYKYVLQAGKMRQAKEDREYQRGRDALKDRLAQADAENKAKLADIRYRRISGQIDDAKAAAEEKDANRELERQLKLAKLETEKSKARKNDRWMPSSKSGKDYSHPWIDVKGVYGEPGKVRYESSSGAAQEKAAIHGGIYESAPKKEVEETKDEFGGKKTKTKTVYRSTGGKHGFGISWKGSGTKSGKRGLGVSFGKK